MGQKKGRYYEQYQVEDVLTFFSGQLVLARSPGGTQVYLQEVKLNRELPPGSKEMLLGFQNENLAPILDVIEERGRIILVHPTLEGEPLSLLVPPRQGLDPTEALLVFRNLLRTAIQLSKLPLPLFTTLDPRNIIIEDNRPFVLFISFHRFSRNQAEKWRYLLYFLLTGYRLETPIQDIESDEKVRDLSSEWKRLLIRSMDPKETMESVLEEADRLELPKFRSKKEEIGKHRRWIYSAAIVVLAVTIGVFWGSWIFDTDAGSSRSKEEQFEQSGEAVRFDSIRFKKEQIETLPLSMEGSFRVFGELKWTGDQPFSLFLESENIDSRFGFRLDQKGRLTLFQRINGETFDVAQSGTFRIQPDESYRMELLYIPRQPFRVSVTEKKTGKKWIAVGNVPIDSTYQMNLKGDSGTFVRNPGMIKVGEESGAIERWMNNHPWLLVNGAGVVEEHNLLLDGDGRVHLRKGNSSFAFKRSSGYAGQPLQMELESTDGSRFIFHWNRDGKMELSRMDEGGESLGVNWVGSSWNPDQETRVSVASESREFTVEMEQGGDQRKVKAQLDNPVSIRRISIVSSSDLQLREP
ncbi:hypothetical protein CHM34_02405 [Paludifilum halophilum]|uniref:Uncharacterized protein n=2 Tax=Paludifilum halophilum TaxID=1642702 RepID=A0A235BD18_9BACL|nr:hypothetical protein CHM34_02405 [Paludifilum halophilum]